MEYFTQLCCVSDTSTRLTALKVDLIHNELPK